jgi:aryl-alcohol dehydrogenase-like predicted oxidoreductase
MTQRTIHNRSVSPIGLGGAQWSLSDDRDDERSIECIRAAVDAGVDLIDTAHAYTTLDEVAHSESLVRRALTGHPLRDDVLIATKGGHWRAGPQDFPIDGRPETLRRHLEASLRTLGVERIGLYQLHHPDPGVPIEESVGALAAFQDEGKIELIGISNVSRDLVDRARTVVRIDSVQNEYSPFRPEDDSLAAYLAESGTAYLAYSPLGGRGGSVRVAADLPSADRVAREHATSAQAVVLAWLLTRSPNLIAIVGARRPSTILDSLSARELVLAPGDLSLIDGDVRAFSTR